MEKINKKSNLRAIAFALAALVAAHSSSAVARSDQLTERVPYGDLNLTNESGIKALDRRLDRAVERVCGFATAREISQQRAIDKCRRETVNSIRNDRELAIAKANGLKALAEKEPRGQTQVSLAE